MNVTTNLARTDATHDELMELIPWYVNGTLDTAERDFVERHVEGCNDCANEVQWLKGLYDVANSGAEVYPLPGQGFDKLRARIELERHDEVEYGESAKPPTRTADVPGGLLPWVKFLLNSLWQRPASWAAVPAALVAVVLVYSNVYTFDAQTPGTPPQGNMTTLTSEDATEHLTSLTVQPASEAARRSILTALESAGAQGELRLSDNGDFRVLLSTDTNLAAVKRLLSTLRSSPSIETAALVVE